MALAMGGVCDRAYQIKRRWPVPGPARTAPGRLPVSPVPGLPCPRRLSPDRRDAGALDVMPPAIGCLPSSRSGGDGDAVTVPAVARAAYRLPSW